MKDNKTINNNLENFSVFCGEIESNKVNKQYIEHEGKRHYIKPGLYLSKDKVKYKFVNGKIEILSIISRKKSNFICEVKCENAQIKLIPFKDSVPFEIDTKQLKYVVEGDRLLIKLNNKLIDGKYVGTLERIICNSRDMDASIKTLCQLHGFKTEFSPKAIEELKNIPYKVLKKDLLNRKDKRKEQFFTIDCFDTKDRDDAIAIEKLPDGGYILRVAISHVTHYIKKDSAIFKEALERGTSVYTPGAVNPQLPQQITNGICSLNEKVDRLTKTVEIRFDKDANILKYKIYDSIINSKKALSYDEVNEYFKSGLVPKNADRLIERLEECKELSEKLTKKKNKRGYINLITDEIKYIVLENEILSTGTYEQGIGQEIIENFMVIANNVIASDISKKNLDFIYRNHGVLELEKLKKSIIKLKNSILTNKEILNSDGNLSGILSLLSNDMDGLIISRHILTSLKKADYGVENIGHYGLGLKEYTHSTSPIRRGTDLVVQYLLDLYNSDNEFNKEQLLAELINHASVFSEREIAADKIEYEAESLKTFDYFKKNNIHDLDVFILDIRKDYIIVKKKGIPEGIVQIKNLEPFGYFDSKDNTIKVRNNKRVYKIGCKLKVVPAYISNMGIVYEPIQKTKEKTLLIKKPISFHN